MHRDRYHNQHERVWSKSRRWPPTFLRLQPTSSSSAKPKCCAAITRSPRQIEPVIRLWLGLARPSTTRGRSLNRFRGCQARTIRARLYDRMRPTAIEVRLKAQYGFGDDVLL